MQYITESNRIHLERDGETIAEVTFPETEKGVFTIDHTYVDSQLRGQGIAAELVKRAVEEIERHGGRVEATCSYAILWLNRNRNRDITDTPLSCPIDSRH